MHLRSKRIVFYRKNSQQLTAQNIGFCKCHFKHFQYAVYLTIQKEPYIYIYIYIYMCVCVCVGGGGCYIYMC